MGAKMVAKRRKAGKRGERGVALVEMSFVVLMMFVLVAGAFDYGLAWQSGMAVNEAARTGARVGSGQATNISADYNALTGVQASLRSAGKIDHVEKVVVFLSSTTNGRVPASCIAASPSGTCNVLTGAQLASLDQSSFNIVWNVDPDEPPTGGNGCLKAGSAVRSGWCPTSRINTQATAQYYGIYIEYEHDNYFPIMGDTHTVKRTAVMRLEPPSI